MFVGRKREIRELKRLCEREEAQFLALYGRRRVGKTYLINSFFDNKFAFAHAGLSPIEDSKHKMKDQLGHFYNSLIKYGLKGEKAPKSWLDAFFLLEKLLDSQENNGQKLVVFIDEIQWIDTPKSHFMTGLEAFWNGYACKKANLLLIVCGSSSSWILNNLVNNHGGLYDRLNMSMCLEPFSLKETEEYLLSNGVEYSRYDIATAYMVFGGIPFYLSYIDRSKSLSQNIVDLFFAKNGSLRNEFDRLFRSIFVNHDLMKTLITVIGEKRKGLTREEIIEEGKIQDSGYLSKSLEALIEGSFVDTYIPFGEKKRGKRYKLTDPFCLFCLFFLEGKEGKRSWETSIDTPLFNAWKGIAFENLCFRHYKAIKKALGISGVSTKETFYSRKGSENEVGAQIDLIIDRADNIVSLCEAKFCENEFAIDKNYHLLLLRRKDEIQKLCPKRARTQNVLLTTYGLKNNEYRFDFANVVTLDELFDE